MFNNKVENGIIHYGVYGQDGSIVSLTMKDTPSNRKLAEWIRMHDRRAPEEKKP